MGHQQNQYDTGADQDQASDTSQERDKQSTWITGKEFFLLNLSRHYVMEDFTLFTLENDREVSNFFQVATAYVIVGIPISYMEVVMGQYTSTGIFHIRHLMPIAQGMSYTYALQVFVGTTMMATQMGDLLTFLYLTLRVIVGTADLQWLLCPQIYEDICFSPMLECPGPEQCINETRYLSSFIYWDHGYMKGAVRTAADADFGFVPYHRAIALGVTWLIIYGFIMMHFSMMKNFVKRVFITLCAHKVLQTVQLFFFTMLISYVPLMIQLDIRTFLNIKAWRHAIAKVELGMALSDFVYIMLGMKSPPCRKTGSFMWICGFASMFLAAIDQVATSAAAYWLCDLAKLPIEQRYLLFRPKNIPHEFGVMLITLAITKNGAIFNVLYLMHRFLLHLCKILLMFKFLTMSMHQRYPILVSYEKYTKSGVCIGGFFFSAIMGSREMCAYRYDLQYTVVRFCQQLNVIILAVIVLYVYGVPRLCDDVHFMAIAEPARFWMVVWWTTPFAFMIGVYWHMFDLKSEFFTYRMIAFAFFYTPYIVFLGITLVKKVYQKKLLTLLRSTDDWAPMDPTQRVFRKTFNPRFDSKRKNKAYKCAHKCLIEEKLPVSDEEEENPILGIQGEVII